MIERAVSLDGSLDYLDGSLDGLDNSFLNIVSTYIGIIVCNTETKRDAYLDKYVCERACEYLLVASPLTECLIPLIHT